MAVAELPMLAKLWFSLTAPVVLIDTVFVLTRAATLDMPHPLENVLPFSLWVLYAKYDHRYAANDDAFVVVQSWLNVAEVFLGLLAVLSAYRGGNSSGIKLALVTSVMTLYKTLLYLSLDVADDGKYTQHNPLPDKILFVVLPSLFWIIVPALVVVQCMRRLCVSGRRIVTAVPRKVKSG